MTLLGHHRRPPNTLTIQPPSPGDPNVRAQRITTPINQIIPHIISPRKSPLPPSPTHSSHSNISGLSSKSDPRGRRGSVDSHVNGVAAPPVPRKDDKRLPILPFPGLHIPRSPRRRGGTEESGTGAGMYDNKLVSVYLPLNAEGCNNGNADRSYRLPVHYRSYHLYLLYHRLQQAMVYPHILLLQ